MGLILFSCYWREDYQSRCKQLNRISFDPHEPLAKLRVEQPRTKDRRRNKRVLHEELVLEKKHLTY